MKKILLPIIVLAAIFGSYSCSSKKEAREYPMFWTWLNYHPKMNLDSICQVMNEIGMDGLMLNASSPDDYRKAIPIAHKYGIEVYAWLWTMNLEYDRNKILEEHPEWFSVNREGKSLADTTAYVGYYKFLCPALPEVREYIKEKVESYCEVDGLSGISIDYHRFVDVILPTTLWPKYGIVQDREHPQWDFGYHSKMIKLFKREYGYDPREQEDPSQDLKWRQFRCDQISEVANMIADVVHSYDKVMAASPFPTPKMSSRMVRQDWGDWNLDIVFPMVYHNFYTEDPSFVEDCMIECSRDKKEHTKLYAGIMASRGQELFESMDAAFAGGAQGIALFTVGSIRTPEMRKQFREYTDRFKALRAANGGVLKPNIPEAANADPFQNKGLMSKIENRIAEIAKEKKVSLGEYKKIDSYDATVKYEVKEKNSKSTYEVTFYLYGDVISGWDIKRK